MRTSHAPIFPAVGALRYQGRTVTVYSYAQCENKRMPDVHSSAWRLMSHGKAPGAIRSCIFPVPAGPSAAGSGS